MDLIKHAVALYEGPEPATGQDLAKILTKELKGKKIQAFGPKGKGLWGSADEEKSYKISKVTCTYSNEEGTFISLDVHLLGYHVTQHGLVYTDKTFIKQFKDMVKASSVNSFIKSLDYSEHGMQGAEFINLDVTTKFPKKAKVKEDAVSEGIPSEMEVHLHTRSGIKKFGKEKVSAANIRAHDLCIKHNCKTKEQDGIIHVHVNEGKTPNDHGKHADKMVTVREVYDMISKKSFDAWYKRELEKHWDGETDTKDIIDDLAKMLGKASYDDNEE